MIKYFANRAGSWLLSVTLLVLFFVPGARAQDITAFSGHGLLSWTNGLSRGTYEVQWSSSLEPNAVWSSDWTTLRNLQGTQAVFTVPVPMFYRVQGTDYPEVTDPGECYARYSNALLNAAVTLPEEICTELRPVATTTPGTDWLSFSNWVDGGTSRWVRVATMKYAGGWTWNNLLTPGSHTLSNGFSSELWVTLCPDLRQVMASYRGTNRTLRMQKALGLPPRSGSYAVAEFYIDPKYLFRPAACPDIRSPSCGLVPDGASPWLAPNGLQGISTGFAAWFNSTYESRGYEATDLDNSWPWTRLGYTFDYENSPNSPVGLSEYVVPNCGDTAYWGEGLVIPYYVAGIYPAESYGEAELGDTGPIRQASTRQSAPPVVDVSAP